MARHLEEQGVRPVPEIARRKHVSENLVHQWLHRARKLEAASSSPNKPPRRKAGGRPMSTDRLGGKSRSVLGPHHGLHQRQGFTHPADPGRRR